jgi:hypothetical protein
MTTIEVNCLNHDLPTLEVPEADLPQQHESVKMSIQVQGPGFARSRVLMIHCKS